MNCMQRPARALALIGGLLLWSLGSQAEHYRIPLFVSAATADAAQGLLRVLNRTEASRTVAVYAIDDASMRSGPANKALNAAIDTPTTP